MSGSIKGGDPRSRPHWCPRACISCRVPGSPAPNTPAGFGVCRASSAAAGRWCTLIPCRGPNRGCCWPKSADVGMWRPLRLDDLRMDRRASRSGAGDRHLASAAPDRFTILGTATIWRRKPSDPRCISVLRHRLSRFQPHATSDPVMCRDISSTIARQCSTYCNVSARI